MVDVTVGDPKIARAPFQAVRKLARLSYNAKTRAQFVRQGGADDEASRLDTEHGIDLLATITLGKQIDGSREQRTIGKQRRDVLENNPRLWEVWHVPNRPSDAPDVVVHSCFALPSTIVLDAIRNFHYPAQRGMVAFTELFAGR